jgi:hypothetical protein
MAGPDELDAESFRDNRGKKEHMVETMQCLMFARDNLPSDVYNEFVKTMTKIWKQWYVCMSELFEYMLRRFLCRQMLIWLASRARSHNS